LPPSTVDAPSRSSAGPRASVKEVLGRPGTGAHLARNARSASPERVLTLLRNWCSPWPGIGARDRPVHAPRLQNVSRTVGDSGGTGRTAGDWPVVSKCLDSLAISRKACTVAGSGAPLVHGFESRRGHKSRGWKPLSNQGFPALVFSGPDASPACLTPETHRTHGRNESLPAGSGLMQGSGGGLSPGPARLCVALAQGTVNPLGAHPWPRKDGWS